MAVVRHSRCEKYARTLEAGANSNIGSGRKIIYWTLVPCCESSPGCSACRPLRALARCCLPQGCTMLGVSLDATGCPRNHRWISPPRPMQPDKSIARHEHTANSTQRWLRWLPVLTMLKEYQFSWLP